MPANHELEKLQERANAFKQRERTTKIATGVARAVATLAICLLITSALDLLLALPALLRLIALAGTIYIAFGAVRQETSHRSSSVKAAQKIEASFKGVGSSLSTAIEFGTDAEKTNSYSSKQLVDKLINRAESRTRAIPITESIDLHHLKKSSVKLALFLLLVICATAFLPQQMGRTTWRFFAPFLSTPAPTWTIIERITPSGSTEISNKAPVTIEVTLGGFQADVVTLLYRQNSGEWNKLPMAEMAENKFSRTLGAFSKITEYKIHAGDAVSRIHTLIPIEKIKLTELRLTLTPPAYTSRPKVELPVGEGEFQTLEGTEVQVNFKANREIKTAELHIQMGESLKIIVAKKQEDSATLGASFTLKEGGEYSIHLRDKEGRTNDSPPRYAFDALRDEPPVVKIKSPSPEVSTPKDRDVKIVMRTTDDFGIKEMGLQHTLLAESKKITLHTQGAVPKEELDVTHILRLALFSLKGGEIISYYAYAIDGAGNQSRSEVQFVWTWGENKYDSESMQTPKPQSALEVEDYIKKEMAIIRSLHNKTLETKNERDKKAIQRTTQDQKDLATDLGEFLKEVQGEEAKTQIDEQVLAHMIKAKTQMERAADALENTGVKSAIDSATEAIAELSRSRRIIMGGGEGTSAFDIPSQNRNSERTSRRQENTSNLRKKANRLPPMLESAKKMRRKLEKLEDTPPQKRSSQNSKLGAGDLAKETRSLAEDLQQETQDLQELSKTPERKLKEAADRIEQSERLTKNGDIKEARQKMQQAERALEESLNTLNQTLNKLDTEDIRSLSSQAKELAAEQKSLSQNASPQNTSEQKSLTQKTKELEQKLANKLSSMPDSEARDNMQQATGELENAQSLMQMAQMGSMQEENHSSENKMAQESAAESLLRAAHAMAKAASSFENQEREALAKAEHNTRELAKEIAEAAGKLSSEQNNLHPSSHEIQTLKEKASRLATEIRSLNRSGENDAKEQSANSLESAERRLKETSRAISNSDIKTARDKIAAATERAEIASKLLSRSTQDELRDLLQDAAKTAGLSGEKLSQLEQELKMAQNGSSPQQSQKNKSNAADKLTAAEQLESDLKDTLSHAEMSAKSQDHKLAEKISELLTQLGREDSYDQKEQLRASLQNQEKVTKDETNLARELVAKQKELAQKIDSLVAESSRDDLQKLKSLHQDARSLKTSLEQIARALTPASPQDPSEQKDSAKLPSAQKLQQLAKDTNWLTERAAENSLPISQKQKAILEATQKELNTLARAVSRNQPINNSSRGFASALEVITDIENSAHRRAEVIIKKRTFSAPKSELAPREYRELVRQYFRALSED